MKVVNKGFLFPFGHHVVQVTVTERQFEEIGGEIVATSRSQAVAFKLSRGAIKLLAKARGGRLEVQVWSGGSVVKTVTLLGPKHKQKRKRHHGHKRHKKK